MDDDRAAAGFSGRIARLRALRGHVRRLCGKHRAWLARVRGQSIATSDLHRRPDLHLLVLRSRRRATEASGSPVEPVCGSMPRRSSPWSRACFWPVKGLLALGVVPRRFWPKSSSGGAACLAGTFVGPFLISPRLSNVLLAGVLTGFLPCGLVYGYLALASSSANVRDGLAHDVHLRRRDRAAHDSGRYGRLAALAGNETKPLANLGRLRCADGVGFDRPRGVVHRAHSRTASRSLPVLRFTRLTNRSLPAHS